MPHRVINPWTWAEPIGFSHGVEVPAAATTLYLAGQVSCGADGGALHAGDLGAQTGAALDNIETVLTQAGFSLGDIVRLNIYTTDVAGYHADGGGVVKERLHAAGANYTSTLLGVAALAMPEFLIELEVTAAGVRD